MKAPAWIVVRISAQAREELKLPIIGVWLRIQGTDFAGTNTSREEVQLPAMLPGDILTVDFHLKLPLLAATEFTLTPAIADGTLLEHQRCDMIEDALEIAIAPGEAPVYGYMHIPCLEVQATRSNTRSFQPLG